MRISDWSSDVCSSDLLIQRATIGKTGEVIVQGKIRLALLFQHQGPTPVVLFQRKTGDTGNLVQQPAHLIVKHIRLSGHDDENADRHARGVWPPTRHSKKRSEERRAGKEWDSTGRSRWSPNH